jgi:membrane-bound metal-dependent hydrolase YbcI (DUF457 family)
MAQAGIHALVGAALRRWAPQDEFSAHTNWLVLGVLLGNLLPDADNLAVAVATIMKLPTEGLHRTFTHSLFTVVAFAVLFYLLGQAIRQPRWGNLGLGLGAGVMMHILLDLLIWFNGVEILWPIPSWVNLWSGVAVPVWFDQLMMPVEFLFFALYFLWLDATARRQGTDRDFLRTLRVWLWVQVALFQIFIILVYILPKGFLVPYGAVYLFSLGMAIAVTIRMRQTLEAMTSKPAVRISLH